MSLDIYLIATRPTTVFEANITHNLSLMADEAGVYKHLWRPNEIGIDTARQLVGPLKKALDLLKSDPERFRKFEHKNKWGTYDHFVFWLEKYLIACVENPDAEISING